MVHVFADDLTCVWGRQVLEVRAAAGGSEASLFAAEIFEMYQKYCLRRGWKFEVMSTSPSEAGKSSLFLYRELYLYREVP